MFEGIAAKVMAGMLSLSALLLSNYTGNEPVFKPLETRLGKNYIQVTARLDNAFENDFQEVFKSGKPIHIMFSVEAKRTDTVVWRQNFRHTVNYDPMNAAWTLYRSETKQNQQFTTYSALITNISILECSIPFENSWQKVEVKTESWLPKITLEGDKREIDLMMLWKFKRPAVKKSVSLRTLS